MMDKSKQMVDFLMTCPYIDQNPLFFNFGQVEDNTHQLTISADDIELHKPYIDGSVEKRYTCVIDSFKSVACIPVVDSNTDENIEDYKEVQDLLDWVNEQGDNGNYPDFGSDCIIDKMEVLTPKPLLAGIESSLNPPVAIYRITVQIDYVDISKKLWK